MNFKIKTPLFQTQEPQWGMQVPPLHIVQEVSGVKYPVFPFEKKEWKWKVFQKSFGLMQDIAF